MKIKTALPGVNDNTAMALVARGELRQLIIKQLICFLVMTGFAGLVLSASIWVIALVQVVINVFIFLINYLYYKGSIKSPYAALGMLISTICFGELFLSIGDKSQADSQAENDKDKASFQVKVDDAVYARMTTFNMVSELAAKDVNFSECYRHATPEESDKARVNRESSNAKIDRFKEVFNSQSHHLIKQVDLKPPYTPDSLRKFPTIVPLEASRSPDKCVASIADRHQVEMNAAIVKYNELLNNGAASALQKEGIDLLAKLKKQTLGSRFNQYGWDAFQEIQMVIIIQLIIAIISELLSKDNVMALKRYYLHDREHRHHTGEQSLRRLLRTASAKDDYSIFLVLDKVMHKEEISRVFSPTAFPDKSFERMPASSAAWILDIGVITEDEMKRVGEGALLIFSVKHKFAKQYLDFDPRYPR